MCWPVLELQLDADCFVRAYKNHVGVTLARRFFVDRAIIAGRGADADVPDRNRLERYKNQGHLFANA